MTDPKLEWDPSIAALIAKLEAVAKCVWIAVESAVARDISETCLAAASALAQIEALTGERDKYRTLAGIGVWHKQCRPNREMAARELAKSQAIINKLADRISELESAASALTSHVWDRNAPTVPYVGQLLQQDMDVARTFNESSDPRAMLAFIKLLAVGRPQPPSGDLTAASALRGVQQDDQKEDQAARGGTMEIRAGQELPQGKTGVLMATVPDDYEMAHRYLDVMGIARNDPAGEALPLKGRIQLLSQKAYESDRR